MSPEYYNEKFAENGLLIWCEYFNFSEFTYKITDQLILKFTGYGAVEFLIINRGNTFPHLKVKNIKLKNSI